MEEHKFINSIEGKGTPPGNFAGRRNRLQQDCTVKLFPPLDLSFPVTAAPQGEDEVSLTSAGSCRCNCNCKKKNKRLRCDSRMVTSALSSRCSCRSSSSLSSWSSCSSSRSSASSNSSSLGEREMSALSVVSRSMEVKDALKRIAEELASDVHVPIEHLEKMNRGVIQGDSRGDPHAPPPSRVLTGAHFMDWYIPRHIAGSRALHRSAKSAAVKRTEIASPMHKPEKQAWVTQIIDPKKTSLPLPTPPKPPVLEHPCPRADNLWEAFSKEKINVNPNTYASHLANSTYLPTSFPPPNFSAIKPSKSALAMKSFHLKNNGRSLGAQGGGVEPLPGAMFTKSQVPNKTWFIVHPDWRLEPGPGEDM